MKNQVHELKTDVTGNVICTLNPDSDCRVLLAGHVDEIALMVTMVTDAGMLKVTNVGGVRPALYLGQKVRILTSQGIIPGVVLVNAGLLKNKELSCKDLVIDLGATSKAEALTLVKPGDHIIPDTDYVELMNERISGRALDNRLGAFIVMESIRRARELNTRVGVYSCTTVGEETTMRGAQWVASSVKPSLAIIVDVTYATDYCGSEPEVVGEIKVGGGPVLCHSSIVNKKINEHLAEAATGLNIPIQYEAAPGRTGTDADRIHFANEGVPVALVSIPLRYMHSPSEVGSLKDVEQIIEVIAAFLANLPEDVNLSPFQD